MLLICCTPSYVQSIFVFSVSDTLSVYTFSVSRLSMDVPDRLRTYVLEFCTYVHGEVCMTLCSTIDLVLCSVVNYRVYDSCVCYIGMYSCVIHFFSTLRFNNDL